MGNPQFKTVDDAAEWVASFLLSISCPEQEAAAAKDCIIRERIDPEILASDVDGRDSQGDALDLRRCQKTREGMDWERLWLLTLGFRWWNSWWS